MKSLRALSLSRRREVGDADDHGFTLIEMVIAIGLIGVVFAAVAAIMTSSLRALSIQKARTQGNEVATQAIEDLQRRAFDALVLCTEAGSPPAGLDDTVWGSSCPASTVGYGEDPCNNVNPGHAPAATYTCTRLNIDFLVKRYIAWVDASHTSKRLAVFVTWEDAAGLHEVSQQSSLRAPTAQSIIGLASPRITAASAGSSATTYYLDGSNGLTSALTLTATSMYLTDADDRVFVEFTALDDDGVPRPESVALAGGGATNTWTGTMPLGTRLAEGTQYITFNGFRAKDGKTTAAFSNKVTFCKVTGCPTSQPEITGMTVTPSTILLGPNGGLQADVAVSMTTKQVSEAGRAQVMFRTLDGVKTVDLAPQTDCTVDGCTWSGVIPKSAGYAFVKETPTFYFSAGQPYVAGSTEPTESGSTNADTKTVTYG